MAQSGEENKEYREAVVSEIAQRMKDAGYTLLGSKVLPFFLATTLSLVGLTYWSLVETDKALANDIKKLQDERVLEENRQRNMEFNLYILCQRDKAAGCIKPEPTK